MDASKGKTSAAGFIILLLVLLSASLAYVFQTEETMKTEGLYPEVKPMAKSKFEFAADKVLIRLEEDLPWKRIVVFAYTAQGWQMGIVKPVYNRQVVILPGDSPDFAVMVKDGIPTGFKVFQGGGETGKEGDFLGLLRKARESSLRYGVQECLYPLCTRCLDVCPVIKYGVVQVRVSEDGTIYPSVNIQNCPRCGKCFEVCKLGILLNPRKVPSPSRRTTSHVRPMTPETLEAERKS